MAPTSADSLTGLVGAIDRASNSQVSSIYRPVVRRKFGNNESSVKAQCKDAQNDAKRWPSNQNGQTQCYLAAHYGKLQASLQAHDVLEETSHYHLRDLRILEKPKGKLLACGHGTTGWGSASS